MATESTAIVNLVDLVKNNRPLPREADDDLLFGGSGRFDPFAMPVQAQPVMLPQPYAGHGHVVEERTIRVPRTTDPQATLKKFTLPVGLFVVAMVLLSIYLAKGEKKAPSTAVVHAPAPAVQVPAIAPPPPPPAPVVAPPVAPVAAAVVTPIEESKPTVEPIDPPTVAAAAPTVEAPQPTVPTVPDAPVAAAEDDAAAAAAAPAAPVKAAKHHREHHRAAKRAKPDTRVATADAPKPAKLEKLGGKAALVLSSSPSREIWIDGRNTKQMTPQRLTLAPGTHNVTLFDKKTRSAKTFQVELKPNATLKVAKAY